MAKQRKPADDEANPVARKIIPVKEETLRTGTRRIETGRVRVHKRVEEYTQPVDLSTTLTNVEVRRVPINRPVDRPPQVRKEGDTIIVPVLEEETVVTTRLILKEEIHLIRQRVRETRRQSVRLRREHVEVERTTK